MDYGKITLNLATNQGVNRSFAMIRSLRSSTWKVFDRLASTASVVTAKCGVYLELEKDIQTLLNAAMLEKLSKSLINQMCVKTNAQIKCWHRSSKRVAELT